MNDSEFVQALKMQAAPDQYEAIGLLERLGYRFCVDFGYENAIERLTALAVTLDDLGVRTA